MNKRFEIVSFLVEKLAVFLCILSFLLVVPEGREQAMCGDSPSEKDKEETIRFRPISNDDYAVFPVNWSAEHRYRLGVIRNLESYKKIFNAAAFAGNKKPYAPDAQIFEKEALVFVCKVIPAVADVDKELRIEKIVARGTTLEVWFAYRNSGNSSTYQIKATAAAWIPKREYSLIKFFEGKTIVKEIQLSESSWSLPE